MKNERGFTLVELILAVVLLAIALPPLLHLFARITIAGTQVDNIPRATSLATSLMEEIRSRTFDEKAGKDANGNWSTPLGPDAGEGANKAGFDDVDDFNGWTESFANDSAYSATVTVDYVVANDLNVPLSIPSPVPDDWTPSYKRVVVQVTSPLLPDGIQVVSLVTEAQSL